jgi:leucyl-tRNA synthetase
MSSSGNIDLTDVKVAVSETQKSTSKPAKAEKAEKSAAPAASAPKSFARRDHIRSIELRIQKIWQEKKVYEQDATVGKPKFFINFPYPYMNGRLHLGHAFSFTKAEFTARFQRLQGKSVLLPFAFHCTGMPIQAAANKLTDEIQKFGCPPTFPEQIAKEEDDGQMEEQPAEQASAAQSAKSAEATIAAKSKGKKSKLVAKGAAGPMRQWDILSKMVPYEEIHEFKDPKKWLNYFPPYGASDLQAFGTAIDWRRSFITTSENPYYDAFIRWQFNRLRMGNKIKFGKRPNVYSVLDGQVCADHDRASGETVGPQEYTIIKLLVLQPYPASSPLNHPGLQGKQVFLAPATLRPETMYGQTNCFVLPEGDYGAFEMVNGDILIMSARAAIGLAHQDQAKVWGKAEAIVTMKGSDLIGLPLKAPLTSYERVYTLPLTTISMGKGTGVVTSVPSDAPDDYVALRELKDKPLWREKFGITAEMVEPYDVIPIVEIEGYGNMSAVTMCERLDIKSPKDAEKLKLAKDEVYLKGFYEGVMIVGDCKGMKVCDAKPIIRQMLIDRGDAIAYFEPESTVMSRSGDECIVALTDQWYLAYGDPEWRDKVIDHIHSKNFNGYNDKIMEQFDNMLGWLKEWACTRQFGLGTQLPWDKQWVIESLSDSTIYMAYYTIAHIIHNGVHNLHRSDSGIQPDDLTDDVFNYIFLSIPFPEGVTSNISMETLNLMKQEFEYWYPFDLRVSAKDLIPNHLTMSLYNHIEIWHDRPEMWPRGIYCNGQIMVNAEKMSKSKGNFLMLLECVESFTADATRFALADAGDSMEDANFDKAVANQAISYLFVEEDWIRSIINDAKSGSLRTGEMLFMDRCLNNELDYLIEATYLEFEKLCYREGLHRGWFDMIIARDLYRDWSSRTSIPMHGEVIMRFVEALVIMMSPICPHWSENLYEAFGHEAGTISKALWPSFTSYDRLVRKQFIFFRDFMKNIRAAALKSNVNGSRGAYVYISKAFDEKKVVVLDYLQRMFVNGSFPADLTKQLKAFLEASESLKPLTKVLMQFGAFMRDEALERGADALATEMVFDQRAILEVSYTYSAANLC